MKYFFFPETVVSTSKLNVSGRWKSSACKGDQCMKLHFEFISGTHVKIERKNHVCKVDL